MKVITVKQKPYKCPQCNVRFTAQRNIARHIATAHTEQIEKLQCFYCKKIYQTIGNHDSHYRKTHLAEHLMYVYPEEVNVIEQPTGNLYSRKMNEFLKFGMHQNSFIHPNFAGNISNLLF